MNAAYIFSFCIYDDSMSEVIISNLIVTTYLLYFCNIPMEYIHMYVCNVGLHHSP